MDYTNLVALVPQGASVVAVIVIVIVFLNFISEQTKLLASTHKTCEEKLEHILDRCDVVITDNTKAVTQLIDAVRDLKTRV